MTLPGRLACSCGASGASASGGSSTAGNSVHVTGKSGRIEPRHRLRVADDRRHRIAAKQRLPFGEDRLVDEARDDAESVAARARRARSAPPRRRDCPCAMPRRSPNSKRACAKGERTSFTTSASGGPTSSPKRSSPVTLARPSMRRTAIADSAGRAIQMRRGGTCGDHGIDDLAIACAAAKHAAERVLHFALLRLRIFTQQRHGAHQHARRADAALRRLMVLESSPSAPRPADPRPAPSTVSTVRPCA